jgi:hypothetical protein
MMSGPRRQIFRACVFASTVRAAASVAGPGLCQPYVIQNLATPGSTAASGKGIANDGTVVGYWRDAGNASHGLLAVNGNVTTLDRPGAGSAYLNGVNEAGLIVESSDTMPVTSAFEYQSGTFTSFSLPRYSGAPEDVNNSGVEVGTYTDAQARSRGFRRSGGAVTTIDYPIAMPTYLSGINDAGLIVGTYTVFGSWAPHGFTYDG